MFEISFNRLTSIPSRLVITCFHSSPKTLWRQCSLDVSMFACTQNIIGTRRKFASEKHKMWFIFFGRNAFFDVAANVCCFYTEELSNFGKPALFLQQCFLVCSTLHVIQLKCKTCTVLKFSGVWEREHGLVCSDIMERKAKKVLNSILIVAFLTTWAKRIGE